MFETLKPYIEYIKSPEGFLIFISALAAVIIIFVTIHYARKSSNEINKGGRGGDAKVIGKNSTAIGGRGGGGGLGGKGGDGGNADGVGDNVFSMGGEGGEAGQFDRGGRGGCGPLHVLMEDHPDKAREIFSTFGITEEMAKKIGKGGDGANPMLQDIQKNKFEENRRNYLNQRNSNK